MRKITKTSFWILAFTKADWTIAKTVTAFVLCIFGLWSVQPTDGHIVLTYPPARKFALDYLDNVHSPEPCGMPRGLNEPTYLEAGAQVNVTWHIAYPHQGSYRIELLDSNYEPITTLVPVLAGREPRMLQFQNSSSSLTNNHTVTLPKIPCSNCTLRITHQAREWNNYSRDVDEGYLFRSCADVNVIEEVATFYKCSSHGKWTDTKCVCDDLYTGSLCQYKEECLKESDCNFRGKCLSTGSDSYPKMRCFCTAGWQGKNCSRESVLKNRVFNKAHFTHRNLAEGFDLYWRIAKDSAEIDFIVQSKSSSWIAIGWRPLSLTSECRQQFPKLPNETYTPHGATPVFGPNSSFGIRPRILETEAESFVDEGPLELRPRRDVVALPVNGTGLDPSSGSLASTAMLPLSGNSSEADLHAMDCTDIVIGFANPAGLGQVQDSYTRDRSTPQSDSFYGGVDNLISAIAFQEDGVTTMRFRRALAAVEPADHAFINSPMHFIYARGQDASTGYSHHPASAMESNNITMSTFYNINDLLYHGSSSKNRGVAQINFFDEKNDDASLQSPCVGDWKTPINCVGDGCRYTAHWEYISDTDSIYFHIQSKMRNKWTGIGFNDVANHMPGADIIIGWVDDDGMVQITDRFADGYRTPRLDKTQHLQNIAGSVDGTFMTIEFTRPRVTNDTDDFQFTDGNCAFFMFPVDGGRFDKISGVISKHQYMPSVSQNKICVQQCMNGTNSAESGSLSKALLKPSVDLLSSAESEPSFTDQINETNSLVALERSGEFRNDTIDTNKTSLPVTTVTATLLTSISPTTAVATPVSSTTPSSAGSTLSVSPSTTSSNGTSSVSFNRYRIMPAGRPAAAAVSSDSGATIGPVATALTSTATVSLSPPFTDKPTSITTTKESTKNERSPENQKPTPAMAADRQAVPLSNTTSAATSIKPTQTSTLPAQTATTLTQAVTRTTQATTPPSQTTTARSSQTPTLASTTTVSSTVTVPVVKTEATTMMSVPAGGGNWTQCRGQWKFPEACDLIQQCEYVVLWEYMPATDDISFYIRSSHPDRWTGIGFSESGSMPISDVIYGFSTGNGNFSIIDATTEGYYPPIRNAQSILTDTLGRVKDGRLELFFTRPRQPQNVAMKARFGDGRQDCPYFLFPVGGGPFDALSGSIIKHIQKPQVSSIPICIRSCPADPTVPDWTMPVLPTTTTTTAATVPTTTTTTTSTSTTPTTTTLMPVIEGTPCKAIFSYPRDCNVSTCIYVAQWDYLPATDEISFIIQSNRLNTWTGIGFSDQGEMPYSDMAIGWVSSDGRPTISDRWSTGYMEPQRDLQQDFTHLGGRVRFGTQLITFTRKRSTDDARDFQFTDTSCPYLIFPVFGGTYDDLSEVINKHMDTPVVSDQRICIRACRQPLSPASSTTANPGFDHKFIVVDQNLVRSTLTTPSTRSRPSVTETFIGGTTAEDSGRATAPTRRKTVNPSSASLTYRSRTPGVGTVNLVETVTSGNTATSLGLTATTLQSPEEMLKLLLLQAGIGNVSIQMPVVSMTEAPRFTPSKPTDAPVTTTTLSTTQSMTTRATQTPFSLTTQPINQSTANVLDTVRIGALASLVVDGAPAPPGGNITQPANLTNPVAPTSATGRTPDSLTLSSGFSILPSMSAPETKSKAEPQIMSSKNVVTGFSMGAPPNSGELVVRSKAKNPTIGPLPAMSAGNPPAVSMSPEEMLKMLLQQSGLGSASIEDAIPVQVVSSGETTTERRPSMGPAQGGLRPAGTTTLSRASQRQPPSMSDTTSMSAASYAMSPSMPVPSIIAAPTTIPRVRLRIQDRPSPVNPDGQTDADVFVGDASGLVPMAPGQQPLQPPSGLPTVDLGSISDNDECGGIFRYPSGCEKDSCSYVATWRPGSSVDEIEFTLESTTPDLWTGIGFSDDKLMKGSDVIYGFIRPNGQPRLVEAYAADYRAPVKDFRNDVRVIGGGRKDNRTFFHFARKLTTKNPNNYNFGNQQCPYYKFPVVGGTYDPNTLMIEKHQRIPLVSPDRICLKPCRAPRPKPAGAAQPGANGQSPSRNTPPAPLGQPNDKPPPNSQQLTVTSAGNSSMPVTADKGVLSCIGEFRFPGGCSEETCEYIAQWEYVGPTDDIKFNIITSRPEEWTGIGFNDKRQMPQADIIYGWLDPDTNKPIMVDAYAEAYMTPNRDFRQDAKNQNGKRTDHYVSLSFTRKRTTKDDRDYQFTDDKCPYLIFPIRGGDFDPSSMMIMKHKATPQVSTQRVCIRSSCAAITFPPTQASTQASVTVTAAQTAPPSGGTANVAPPPTGTEAAGATGAAGTAAPTAPSVVVPVTVANSGKVTDFAALLPCEGSWRYPENCVEPNCIYVASWNFLDDADAIRFVIKAKAAGWTGIGFNDDMMMANADAIIGWVTTKNTVVVTDRHCDGNVGAPMDDEQTVYDISGRREDGYQIIEFSRKRDTQDPNGQNYVFGDQKCPFFIFPIVGGSYDSFGGIQAHSQKAKPKISPQRICVRSCNIDVPRRMVVSFRIVDRSYQPELDSRQSGAFKKLEGDLAEQLGKLLSNTPGYRGSRVIAFRPGSVIADVEIIIDPTANQTSVAGAKTIKTILTNQIQQKQQIGSFAIDPSSLSVSSADQIVLSSGTTSRSEASTAATNQKAPESEVRTYAIIGGVCGIIAILLFLAFGKVWYDRKSRLARRRERVEKTSTSGMSVIPPPQYPRRQAQSHSSSVEAIRPDVYGRPNISQPKPLINVGEIRSHHHNVNGGVGGGRGSRSESIGTRRSSANPPPDYYANGETPGNVSRKTRRTIVADEHQLQRLSTDESDRTFTTYSSSQSRPELRDGKKERPDGTPTYHDWNQIDDTYHRPPDFYFMPSQRRWTQVPQNF